MSAKQTFTDAGTGSGTGVSTDRVKGVGEGTGAVTGSCLCGRVSLSVGYLDRHVVACHCKQCRKQTGHFVAATRASNKQLSIDGGDNLNWYRASPKAERGFCKHCGSLLMWRALDSAYTSIMAGCLDRPTGLQLDRHIFVDDKGDYYDIEPGVESYPQSD